jgi:hypothetical protein
MATVILSKILLQPNHQKPAVASILSAIIFQGHPDRSQKLWNTVSTKRNYIGVANEKLYKIVMCCFSDSHAALKCKRKD